MSEQQPLLSGHDSEAAAPKPENIGTLAVWRERTAGFLESKRLHKAVITLARTVSLLSLLHHTFTFWSVDYYRRNLCPR